MRHSSVVCPDINSLVHSLTISARRQHMTRHNTGQSTKFAKLSHKKMSATETPYWDHCNRFQLTVGILGWVFREVAIGWLRRVSHNKHGKFEFLSIYILTEISMVIICSTYSSLPFSSVKPRLVDSDRQWQGQSTSAYVSVQRVSWERFWSGYFSWNILSKTDQPLVLICIGPVA